MIIERVGHNIWLEDVEAYRIMLDIPYNEVEWGNSGEVYVPAADFCKNLPRVSIKFRYAPYMTYIEFLKKSYHDFILRYKDNVNVLLAHETQQFYTPLSLFVIDVSTIDEVESIVADAKRNGIGVFKILYSEADEFLQTYRRMYGTSNISTTYSMKNCIDIDLYFPVKIFETVDSVFGEDARWVDASNQAMRFTAIPSTPSLKYYLDCIRVVGSVHVIIGFDNGGGHIGELKRILL